MGKVEEESDLEEESELEEESDLEGVEEEEGEGEELRRGGSLERSTVGLDLFLEETSPVDCSPDGVWLGLEETFAF